VQASDCQFTPAQWAFGGQSVHDFIAPKLNTSSILINIIALELNNVNIIINIINFYRTYMLVGYRGSA
jgi:hypothetical protein